MGIPIPRNAGIQTLNANVRESSGIQFFNYTLTKTIVTIMSGRLLRRSRWPSGRNAARRADPAAAPPRRSRNVTSRIGVKDRRHPCRVTCDRLSHLNDAAVSRLQKHRASLQDGG
jgi:hypothetical protein